MGPWWTKSFVAPSVIYTTQGGHPSSLAPEAMVSDKHDRSWCYHPLESIEVVIFFPEVASNSRGSFVEVENESVSCMRYLKNTYINPKVITGRCLEIMGNIKVRERPNTTQTGLDGRREWSTNNPLRAQITPLKCFKWRHFACALILNPIYLKSLNMNLILECFNKRYEKESFSLMGNILPPHPVKFPTSHPSSLGSDLPYLRTAT